MKIGSLFYLRRRNSEQVIAVAIVVLVIFEIAVTSVIEQYYLDSASVKLRARPQTIVTSPCHASQQTSLLNLFDVVSLTKAIPYL